MSRFMALYRMPEKSEEAAAFEAAYRDTHLPLVAQTPGLSAVEVTKVASTVHGHPPLLLMAVMTFRDEEAMEQAFRSEAWRESGRNLAQIGGLELSTMAILGETESIPVPSTTA